MDLQELVRLMSTELRQNFEKRVRLISHPGEIGTAREEALRTMLESYLPQRCGVDTGFVIDSDGNESNQIDIVIFDRNYSPVFEIVNEKRYFPCETVLAVGEVKTEVNTRQLEDSFEKIESVKALNRAGAKKMIGPGAFGERLEENKHIDQIFGFIFSKGSMNIDTLVEKYVEQLEERERNLWPNYFCDYNNVNIGYHGTYDQRSYLGADAMGAEGIYTTESEEMNFGLFHAVLNWFLTQASIGRPNLFSYYDTESISTESHYFDSEYLE
ncbi:DUF6602 domain-containing protein [Halomontanus rarus]|uniref:DUF6602 domain-containing protein n=1 Tax=Halomontanus rarus TaxID=3034020 RepID=UPI0023E8E215|nr:DUF6602 domain-containing protein [Halovivax sp. TS33]